MSDSYGNFGVANTPIGLPSNSYNAFGVTNSNMNGLATIYNTVTESASPQALSFGYITSDMQSANFSTGVSGWRIRPNGDAEFQSLTGVTLTGVTISGGTISGSTISGGTITGSTIKTSSSSTRVELNDSLNAFLVYLSGNIVTAIGGTGGRIIVNHTDGTFRSQIYGSVSGTVFDTSGNVGASTSGVFLTTSLLGSIASENLGDATYYWNDVSYKTLTDRGCIGWYDDGVELQDGRIVSDTEALLAIRPHPTKKTPKGKVRMDYKTMPKHVYTPATFKGELLPRDENDQPYLIHEGKKRIAEDGAETTALLAIMIGAIKELTNRVKELESRQISKSVL